MVELFSARLRTPEILSWARRDGVVLRDIEVAAEGLRHTLLEDYDTA